ncbi:MAG: ethanolamine utilization protein EutH [Clostridia bacterium]|nr:ethanolamine utilization protein EutH [Clostridia bacterium]
MKIVTYVFIAFAVIGAADRIFGSKLGLGKEFEKGIMMLGPLTLSMTGMLIMAPLISQLLSSVSDIFPDFLEFSVIPSCILANDMGASPLSLNLAGSDEMGYFNGLIVASMMGCTVSFIIPYALQVADKKHHSDILFGILCGIVTIPVGCIVAGLMLGFPIKEIILDLVPLLVIAGLIAFGLIKFRSFMIKFFKVLAFIIQLIIIAGLVIGIIEFLTGYSILPYVDTLENSMSVIINIACVMAGAFPLLSIINKLLKVVLKALGKMLGINENSSFGLLATLGTCVTTFESVDKMDKKGIVLNSAFAVSASFVFIDHLAFTLSYNAEYVPYLFVGKLISGVSALLLALALYKNHKRKA